jgi:hypothetical protein
MQTGTSCTVSGNGEVAVVDTSEIIILQALHSILRAQVSVEAWYSTFSQGFDGKNHRN